MKIASITLPINHKFEHEILGLHAKSACNIILHLNLFKINKTKHLIHFLTTFYACMAHKWQWCLEMYRQVGASSSATVTVPGILEMLNWQGALYCIACIPHRLVLFLHLQFTDLKVFSVSPFSIFFLLNYFGVIILKCLALFYSSLVVCRFRMF